MGTSLCPIGNTRLTGKETRADWEEKLSQLKQLDLKRVLISIDGKIAEEQGDWTYEVEAERELMGDWDEHDRFIARFESPFGVQIDLWDELAIIGSHHRYSVLYSGHDTSWFIDFRTNMFKVLRVFGGSEVIYLADNSCNKLCRYFEAMALEGVSYHVIKQKMIAELGEPVTDFKKLDYSKLNYRDINEFFLDTFEHIRDGHNIPIVHTPQTSDNPYLWFGHHLRDNLKPSLVWYDRLTGLEEIPTTHPVSNTEYVQGLQTSTAMLKETYVRLFGILQQDMPEALGATGGPHDRQKMNMALVQLVRCCTELQQWEQRNLQHMPASDRLKECRSQLRGHTSGAIVQLNLLADHLIATFSTEEPPKEVTYEMTFEPTTDLQRIYDLLDSFTESPEPEERPKEPDGRSFLKTLGTFWLIDKLWSMK